MESDMYSSGFLRIRTLSYGIVGGYLRIPCNSAGSRTDSRDLSENPQGNYGFLKKSSRNPWISQGSLDESMDLLTKP